MYQILERTALLRVILFFGIAGFAIAWLIVQPVDQDGWIHTASFSVSISIALILVLGYSPVWRAFWWILPPLNRWVFPDLNGDWETTMESNIGEIAKYHPVFKEKKPTTVVPGKITIKQNWFFVTMTFHGNDGYSNSDTIFVRLLRTPESNRFRLAYVYENHTPKQKDTDEQMHYGAGIAEVHQIDGQLQIDGLYWTNRNWPRGLNTAGKVTMIRAK